MTPRLPLLAVSIVLGMTMTHMLPAQTGYTITLFPGLNSVANHLDIGKNTLDEVFPRMPDGALFFKFDRLTQSFYPPAVFSTGAGWDPAGPAESNVLRPGEGGFIRVDHEWTVTLRGQPTASHPRTDVGPGFNCVGCQTLGDCLFDGVFAFGPRPGDTVYLLDRPFPGNLGDPAKNASSIHTFEAGRWDTVPVFKQGRAAMVYLTRGPHLTHEPTSQSVLVGSTATFSATAIGTPPLSYQWRWGGVLLAGEINSTLVLPQAQPGDAGAYSVTVSNSFGMVTSRPAFLVVLTPPTILQDPTNVTAVVGDRVDFTVAATGTPPLSYQWRLNNQTISNAVQGLPVLTLSNVQPASAGYYHVTVTNPFGTATSKRASLTVLEPPRIMEQPVGRAVDPGASVTFRVSATSTPPPAFSWRLNGVVIPGASNSILALREVRVEDSGIYSVTVHNPAGAVDSEPAPLYVQAPFLPFADNFDEAGAVESLSGEGRGQNFRATSEPGEPKHFGKSGGRSVWLRWVAPTQGIVTFRTAGSSFDTLLAAYRGQSLDTLDEMASDDDSAGFLCSQIQFNAIAGEVYHIVVDGLAGAEGDIVLSWLLEPTTEQLPVIRLQPQDQLATTSASNVVSFFIVAEGVRLSYQWYYNDVPVNGEQGSRFDVLADPKTVGTYFVRVIQDQRFLDSRHVVLEISTADPGADPAKNLAKDKLADALAPLGIFPSPGPPRRLGARSAGPLSLVSGYAGTQVFSTYGSVTEPGEPVHCGVVGGASQWFYYIPPASGTVFVNTEGSSFDTILAVYTGPGTSFSTLVPVACDNNSGSDGQTSKLSFPGTGSTTYFIAVDGVGGATGTVNLSYRLLVPMVLSRTALNSSVFRFDITASPVHPFTIQVSTNLSNWSKVVTTNSASGTLTFFESNTPAAQSHHYRTRQMP